MSSLSEQMHHGIVIGGSVAGLLTARVMSDSFERVTIVERDELTEEAVPRKGVPQGRQLHGMLPLGMRINEELFPGLTQELRDEGAASFDLMQGWGRYTGLGWQARSESDVEVVMFTRPLYEAVLRRRVMAIPNVEAVRGDAVALLTSDDGKAVTGVEVKRDGVEAIAADLVVDASGHGSRSPKWMEKLGFGRPVEQQVKVRMGYAGCLVRLPEGLLPGGLRALTSMPYPGHHRGGTLFPQENGLFALMACGMMGDYPPSDRDEFLDFLADAPSPLLAEVARQAEPVSPITTYHKEGNVWRRWEELDPRPGRFIVAGDAVGSYNPVYGQGMTVAAVGAVELGKRLQAPDADLDSLPKLVQQDIAAACESAFSNASAVDVHYPGVELEAVELPSSDGGDYFLYLEQLSVEDPEVARAMYESFGWMRPELLFSDEMKAKVAAWAESGRQPANTDPTRVPPPFEAASR